MLRTRPWLSFLVALVLAGACRCDDPGLGGARGDFRPQETELIFGRVLEGEQSRRTVTLVGTGRAGVTVAATTESPFSVAEDSVSVPGGGTATLEVVFTAGSEPVEGTLVLTAGTRTETVVLKGEGVRPLACIPMAQCQESRFVLDPGICVESPAPDGTVCIPSSKCEERGLCQAGVCVGSPRLCDDDNPCTVDSCSLTEGCVTTPVVCPQPSNPCRVGVCEPSSGCGEEDAPNFSVCGPVSCKAANVCFSGTCRTVEPAPDGLLCAPATPCQEEGTCNAGECVQPDAGDLLPSFSQRLDGVPVKEPGGPVLLVHDDDIYTSLCGEDAGCRLVSFTDNGLLRFEAPYPDGGPRTLLTVSDAGVLVHEPQALESYALASPGELLWLASLADDTSPGPGLEPSTGVGRVALTEQGEVVALVSWRPNGDAGVEPDGGVDAGTPEALATLVVLDTDGGVRRRGPVEGFEGEGARVALDEEGAVLLCTEGGGLVSRAEPEPDDAGSGFITLPLVDAEEEGGASLAVAGGRLFAGARRFASTDGGSQARVTWDGGAQHLVPFGEPALLLDDVGYAFARACPDAGGVPCTPEVERLMLRALDARTGETRWEVSVLPVDAPGTLHEAALVSGGAVGTLTDVALDGGPLAHVQLFAQGERLAVCALRDRPRIAGAAHVGSTLYIILEREGAWWLEAFDLGLTGTAETRGWPQRHGIQGTRRARP